MRPWITFQRSRTWTRLLAGGLAAATTLALAACGGSSSGGASASAAETKGGSLTVLVEGGGHAELQPVADLYKKQTGTKVKFVELPYAGLYDRLST
jgi:ABC-type glycerol-3-phosphate transport system substrate-binding protein